MTKEHKKLYKAGKNWIVATLTATTITLLGGIGAYTVHADTTIESSQDVQTNQVNNTNNSVTLNNNQPVAVQSSQTAQNNQSVKGNQTNQTVPSSATDAADTSNSDGLDSNIYGTVNVKDWDYQNDSNTFNLTSYHGQDTRHIIVPNLNDFDNAGVKIGNATGVGISSELARSLASQSLAFAISKTSGKYSDKVTATDNDWSSVFSNSGLINADVSNLDTRNITDMRSLFSGSFKLKTVGDLSHWDTSNVRNMSFMFDNYKGVIGDLSHWNVSNVRNMRDMFGFYKGVIGDLSHWNVSNVRNMSDMFGGYKGVIGDLSHWNVSNVRDMSYMFFGSSLPYKIVAANGSSIVPNQVTLRDNTGKFLAIIDTPTIYDSNKSVRSTVDGIVQAEIDKLNKLHHTLYETPKIISDGDDDYSIANATYVVNNESPSKTGLINYVDQDGKVVKTDQVSGKVGDTVDVKLSLPDGYELANKDEQVPSTITVTENGIGTINVNVKKINTTNTGWNQQGDDWLYMQKNGYLAKGWNYLNGHWFYFDLQSGIMKTGIQSIGNSFYYLNAQHDGTYGAMKTGWQFVNGHWIGLQGSGNAYVGWQAINGHWYYFDPQTAYALTNWQDINNHWYYFDPINAWAQTGWQRSLNGFWYYLQPGSDAAAIGWNWINGHWYYFNPEETINGIKAKGAMFTGRHFIDNRWNRFDLNGHWLGYEN